MPISDVNVNFQLIAPILTVAAAAIIVLVLDLILRFERARRPWFLVTVAGLLLAGWYTFDLWQYIEPAVAAVGGVTAGNLSAGISGFAEAFHADRFSLAFNGIILAAALGGTLLSVRRREDDMSGFLAVILLAAAGMMAIVGGSSLITLFIGLELFSLSLYVGVGFRKNDLRSKEGALKYLILGSVASGFLLYGFALIYGSTGTVLLSGIQQYWESVGAAGMTTLYGVGLALALIGFAFKMALVPFHAWAPDAYEGAPAALTAFMAVGTKAAAFAALIRLLSVSVPLDALGDVLIPIVVLGMLSMFVGSILAVQQQNMKRLLAYSGISHAGYLILALPGLTSEGISAAVFYLLGYLFMTLGAFAIVVWLGDRPDAGAGLAAYRGLFYRRPVLAAMLTLFLLSLAGVPATGGFMGKLLLLRNGIDQGVVLLVVSFILTTGISSFAYLRVVLSMCQKPAEAAVASMGGYIQVAAAAEPGTLPGEKVESASLTSEEEADREVRFSWSYALVVGIAAIGTLYLGLFPQSILSGLGSLLALQ